MPREKHHAKNVTKKYLSYLYQRMLLLCRQELPVVHNYEKLIEIDNIWQSPKKTSPRPIAPVHCSLECREKRWKLNRQYLYGRHEQYENGAGNHGH